MTSMTPLEYQDLERKITQWQREDERKGGAVRTREQIRTEILHAYRTDRLRQLNVAMDAPEQWKWALEYAPDEVENFRLAAERRMSPLFADSPYIEYGTQWPLSEEAHGPGKIVVYAEESRTAAEKTIREDREASGSTEDRGILVWHYVAGPWREVKD